MKGRYTIMREAKTFNWIAFWLLGALTCGIYTLYVWYEMTAVNNELAEKHEESTIPNFLIAILLGVITCGIYQFYWYYKFMSLQVKIAEKSGVRVAPTKNPFLLLILALVPIYSFYMLCDNYNRTVLAN